MSKTMNIYDDIKEITANIYLAAPCDSEKRTLVHDIVKELHMLLPKCSIYCPWEFKVENAWDYSQEEWSKKVFEADITAIQVADTILAISTGRISTAGTNWEIGYAYALKKNVWVIQINNEPTSLMIYNGCTRFVDAGSEDLYAAIEFFAQNFTKQEPRFLKTTTILT